MSDDTLTIHLPDGSSLELEEGATAADAAAAIGPGLARDAVAARVNGELWDLERELPADAEVEIVTRSDEDEDALYVLRHSAAHVLATAVRELWPEAGIGFGPPVDEGFYYDFDVPEPFTPDDLGQIEEKMEEVVDGDLPFERREVSREEARELFSDDPLKLERLEEIPEEETISVYRDGPFLDLCRGPHVPDTGEVENFRLTSAAGAYWRGDESNRMLQRIYGTAFYSEDALEEHLERIEQAKERDHRKLGRELGLFSIQEEVGPGLVHWHPKGARIQKQLRDWLEDELDRRGYEFVYTPHITSEELLDRSGHLEAYREMMYPPMEVEGEREPYRLKPMNCPMHTLIFDSETRSYRDLPIRLSEIANVYRHERSGTLHGMLRVRMLTMDDAHVFCTPEQIEGEIADMLDLVDLVMNTFGFDYRYDLATRPEERIGDEAVWDQAEEALEGALENSAAGYEVDDGGGAFYGPKIDIKFEDALGRDWQGATIQLDFVLPERFELEYIGSDNSPHRPVMIHRAILGTMERFVGGLIEHFGGAFPLWLAPEQVRVLPITDDEIAGAEEVAGELAEAGLRVSVDSQSDTLSYRIREAELEKIPYTLVVGQRELEAGTVAVRARGAEDKQVEMDVGDFLDRAREQIGSRALEPY